MDLFTAGIVMAALAFVLGFLVAWMLGTRSTDGVSDAHRREIFDLSESLRDAHAYRSTIITLFGEDPKYELARRHEARF